MKYFSFFCVVLLFSLVSAQNGELNILLNTFFMFILFQILLNSCGAAELCTTNVVRLDFYFGGNHGRTISAVLVRFSECPHQQSLKNGRNFHLIGQKLKCLLSLSACFNSFVCGVAFIIEIHLMLVLAVISLLKVEGNLTVLTFYCFICFLTSTFVMRFVANFCEVVTAVKSKIYRSNLCYGCHMTFYGEECNKYKKLGTFLRLQYKLNCATQKNIEAMTNRRNRLGNWTFWFRGEGADRFIMRSFVFCSTFIMLTLFFTGCGAYNIHHKKIFG